MPSQPGEPVTSSGDETSDDASFPTSDDRADVPVDNAVDHTVGGAADDAAVLDGEEPVPDEAELERTATPATVRRAPKFSAFITFGALGGMVLGLLIALIFHPGPAETGGGAGLIAFLDGEGSVRAILVVTGGVVGAFVGGALAVRADRRSRPPRIGS